ncbi:MAG: hypothetical protein ABIO40_11860 [Devosia sp.]
MRKTELDRLLLNAVAEAIGQPLPKAAARARPQRQSARAQARKHLPVHFPRGAHDNHAHA